MPRFDLRRDAVTLDPQAPFKVLAVMCHPRVRAERERMIALIQAESGTGRGRRAAASPEEFVRMIDLHAPRVSLSGALLLTLLQLNGNGEPTSLNRAIRLVSTNLPRWHQLQSSDWMPDAHLGHHPHSRRKVREAFATYRPVAHLWAALIHGVQHGRDDIWPGSNSTLPRFLGYADAYGRMGQALPWLGRARRFTLTASELWTFLIPKVLTESIRLEALPLMADQRAILNDM